MGFVRKLGDKVENAFGEITGKNAAKDIKKESKIAAENQLKVLNEAYQPGIDATSDAFGLYSNFIKDPNAQVDYTLSNPLLTKLSEQAQRKIMQNQAVRGKLGTGGTLVALQDATIDTGIQLANQRKQDLGSYYDLNRSFVNPLVAGKLGQIADIAQINNAYTNSRQQALQPIYQAGAAAIGGAIGGPAGAQAGATLAGGPSGGNAATSTGAGLSKGLAGLFQNANFMNGRSITTPA